LCILLILAMTMACTIPPTQDQNSISLSTPVEEVSGSLWVRILAPADNAVVATQVVEVRGEAPEDTVLSINDEILIVSSDQLFSLYVTLEEGLNVIEIVASDYDGNEISHILTITYQP